MLNRLLKRVGEIAYNWSGLLFIVYYVLAINCMMVWFIYRENFSILLGLIYIFCVGVQYVSFIHKHFGINLYYDFPRINYKL